METYYINLDTRPDKNELFLKRNGNLTTCRRFSAVDGSGVDPHTLMEFGIIDPGLDCYSRGALGCALSHKSLWDFAERRDAAVTIIEDDAILNHAFAQQRAEIIRQLPPDWDIILWGWNFDSLLHLQLAGGPSAVMCFDHLITPEHLEEFRNSSVPAAAVRLRGAFGTVAYTVSPKGARRLNHCCFPLQKEYITIPGLNRQLLNVGIDVVMNKYYPSLQAYAAFPPLVITQNDKSTSDVSRA